MAVINAAGDRDEVAAAPATAHRPPWRVLGAESLLLLAAILWGGAFVAQKRAVDLGIDVMPITATRFLIGAAMLAPFALLRWRHTGASAGRQRRHLWIGGIAAGSVMFAATALQQQGLRWTTPGVAGFITGLYVLFVPLLGRLFGIRAGWPVWAGAIMASIGLYLMSVHGRIEINPGDLLVLLCAVAWAMHVLVIGWAAPRTDAIVLSVVQFAVTGSLGAMAALAAGQHPFDGFLLAPWDLLYLGVIAVGVAFTLQVVGQRVAPAPHAAIILSLEAVFAAIAGWLLLGEAFASAAILGASLMLAGMIVSQVIRPPRPVDAPSPRSAADGRVD